MGTYYKRSFDNNANELETAGKCCWVGIIQQLVVSLSPWYKEIEFNNKSYFNVCVLNDLLCS